MNYPIASFRVSILCVITLLIPAFLAPLPAASRLPDHLDPNTLVFIYVHGFGEARDPLPFEAKMREFLKPLGIPATVITHRWNYEEIKLNVVVNQWTRTKPKADQAASGLAANLERLEREKIRYVIVGYSLGCRVVAEALKTSGAPLQQVRGIFFLGAALPHDYKLDPRRLPSGMKITSYYSSGFDEVLKFSFYNAEGTRAGGEVGFDDTAHFQNYRTVCTHVHKGGPIQRDYANLAPAIAYLTFFREKMFVEGTPTKFNLATPVMDGEVNWNDIVQIDPSDGKSGALLIQQNAITRHYRAITVGKDGKRTRRAWGTNLHAILKELGVFPEPYARVISNLAR